MHQDNKKLSGSSESLYAIFSSVLCTPVMACYVSLVGCPGIYPYSRRAEPYVQYRSITICLFTAESGTYDIWI